MGKRRTLLKRAVHLFFLLLLFASEPSPVEAAPRQIERRDSSPRPISSLSKGFPIKLTSTEMADAAPAEVPAAAGEEKPKPCCACPETKQERDACIVEKGEENCGDLIEAHKACMKKMGFDI